MRFSFEKIPTWRVLRYISKYQILARWTSQFIQYFNKKITPFFTRIRKNDKNEQLSNLDLKLVETINENFKTPIGQINYPQILSLIFTAVGLVFTASVAISMCCTAKKNKNGTDKEIVYLNPSAPSYPILRENRKDWFFWIEKKISGWKNSGWKKKRFGNFLL